MIATPHREPPVDESVLPRLPPGRDLPPVTLPKFRVAHPRLPHPTAADVATLRKEQPRLPRQSAEPCTAWTGRIRGIRTDRVRRPGQPEISTSLFERLRELKPDWRGHVQAAPLALAYDWLYDRWSEPQRAALRDKVLEACNHMIEVIRVDRLSPYNVILYNAPFQALVACAIAVYRDDERGEPVMRFTYDLWKNRVLPVWRQVMGRHGGWHEGGEYVGIGIGQAVYRVPAMWRFATGEDMFAAEPGIRGFLDFLVYRTMPDGTDFRWGDAGYFDRAAPDAAAARDRVPPSARPTPCSARRGSLRQPLGPGARSPIRRSSIPTRSSRSRSCACFDGIGLVVARSDWSPEATYVTFKAGDNYWSHAHLDQGAFTIYKGGPLAIDSGLYGPEYGSDHHMNYTYQTIAHNAITVTDPSDNVPAPGKDKARPIANDGGQRRIGSGWGVEAAPLDRAEWEAKRETYQTGAHRARDRPRRRHGRGRRRHGRLHEPPLGRGHVFARARGGSNAPGGVFGYDRVDDVVVVYDDVESSNAAFKQALAAAHGRAADDRRQPVHGRDPAPTRARAMAADGSSGYVVLPEQHALTAIGGPGFEFFVDGRNYDEGGRVRAKLSQRRGSRPVRRGVADRARAGGSAPQRSVPGGDVAHRAVATPLRTR